MMKRHTHFICGALALGVVFASGAAFAQSAYNYPIGRPVNDGGLVPGAVSTGSQAYAQTAPQAGAYKYPVGRNVDDGGLVPEPTAASMTTVVHHGRYHHIHRPISQ
jgi:hypothetical protein